MFVNKIRQSIICWWGLYISYLR